MTRRFYALDNTYKAPLVWRYERGVARYRGIVHVFRNRAARDRWVLTDPGTHRQSLDSRSAKDVMLRAVWRDSTFARHDHMSMDELERRYALVIKTQEKQKQDGLAKPSE